MRIAVLSGKGGTGKTFVSINLSMAMKNSTYVDCDVEEPNGHLFFKPLNITKKVVNTTIPIFDGQKCIGCRKCVDFCKFNALVLIKNKPVLFGELCHSCGGCSLMCSEHAVSEKTKPVGTVEVGTSHNINIVTGIMNMGEVSAVPVIKHTLQTAFNFGNDVVIDCPPGSGCSVMESVTHCDYCILVVEPTAFGFHNFKMVYELVSILGKPCGIVINKSDVPYAPLLNYCKEENINILMEIPYSEKLAHIGSIGDIAYEKDCVTKDNFDILLKNIQKEVGI